MKYRLKDKELQRKLDEISNGDFSKNLHPWEDSEDGEESQIWASYWGKNIHWKREDEDTEGIVIEKSPQFEVSFPLSDLEAIPEYDHTRWNCWPDVEPPQDTLLRIEVITERFGEGTPEPSGGKVRCRGCATYRRGFWMLGEKITVKPRETVRFRPWDDTTAPTRATLNKKILQEIIKALESHPEAYDLGYLIDDVTEAANELPDEESEK